MPDITSVKEEETKMRDRVDEKLNTDDQNQSDTQDQQKSKTRHKSGVSSRPTIARTDQEALVLRKELERKQKYQEKCISLYFFDNFTLRSWERGCFKSDSD